MFAFRYFRCKPSNNVNPKFGATNRMHGDWKKVILDAHNKFRSAETTAKDMFKMVSKDNVLMTIMSSHLI